MALVLTLGLTQTVQAQRHRHNPALVGAQAKADTTAATAYSDTTSRGTDDEDSTWYDADDAGNGNGTVSFTDADDPFKLMAYLGTLGVGGVFIAIFCVIVALLVCASPLIFVALIIYWLMRRKKTEYQLVEKAIENGRPIPDGVLRKTNESNDAVWRKGIHNIAIGVGLIIFGIFVTDALIGIGALVACWGIGQCVIARTSASGRKPTSEDDFYEDIPRNGESSDRS